MLRSSMSNRKGGTVALVCSCLFAFLLVSLSLEAQGHSASLVIQPASGKPAAEIKIIGSKFQPGEEVEIIMQVGDLYHGLGTEKTDVVVADQNGNFNVASGIPVRTPPGVYKVEATGGKGSTAVFNVEVIK